MPYVMSAEDLAYTDIKERILSGCLMPGDRLVHRNLAKELGISSGPVVLALRMLEREGLVVNAQGMGAFVRFHEAVVNGSHSADLRRIMECPSIMLYSMRMFAFNMNIHRLITPTAAVDHDPIVEAISNRDADTAEVLDRDR